MSDVVLFEERPAENGFIGHATLNRPEKLNTLTTEMIALLHQQFTVWADDPACKAVFLDGAGEKAFCAGGDVVAVTTDPSPEMAVGREFFKTEYDLNYFMHTFPKPMLVWGGGICMGGGFGLLQGSSTRIVSDTSRLAMPELAIGFHPDVGGSWFLQRVSAPLGEVIALTGVHFSGADAVELGLADVLVANEHELAQAAASATETGADAQARSLLASGVGAVVLTLGAKGSALYFGDEAVTAVPAAPAEVRDTTGAGDAFVGALAAALAAGQSLPAAVASANRYAARVCEVLGAQTPVDQVSS